MNMRSWEKREDSSIYRMKLRKERVWIMNGKPCDNGYEYWKAASRIWRPGGLRPVLVDAPSRRAALP